MWCIATGPAGGGPRCLGRGRRASGTAALRAPVPPLPQASVHANPWLIGAAACSVSSHDCRPARARARSLRYSAAPDGGGTPAVAPSAAAAAADEKLAAFEAALGGVPRAALLHLLERAPPQVRAAQTINAAAPARRCAPPPTPLPGPARAPRPRAWKISAGKLTACYTALKLADCSPPRAPSFGQVCAFSAETLELTLASLEAALGYDRAVVSQLVRHAPEVLISPHEPVAALRLLSSMLRLPARAAAASVRTRLGVLALGERRLRARCAALGRLLQCDGARRAEDSAYFGAAAAAGGGGGGDDDNFAVSPAAGSIWGARSGSGGGGGSNGDGGTGGGGGARGGWAGRGDEAGDEAAFAAFAARHPGQALALVAHPAAAVAARMAAASEALGGAPLAVIAALARARPLVLELSPVVLRSRAQVLADAALVPGSLADRVGGAAHTAAAAAAAQRERAAAGRGGGGGAGDGGAAAGGRVAALLASLCPEEMEGLSDRLLLAPHSLHLWLQQLASLLPGRPQGELVRLLLRLKVRPPEVSPGAGPSSGTSRRDHGGPSGASAPARPLPSRPAAPPAPSPLLPPVRPAA
jgi:hypothetical protein